LREISRYQVALKASRTSRGIPLLEDIPIAGTLFRPLPSDESSLQQNIILGQTTVYPTLYDLMGLRWSKHVVDLDHVGVRDAEHVIRGRNKVISDFVFDRASEEVDDFLDISNRKEEHYRPDLYHRQHVPSPYHPGGYIYHRDGEPVNDPTGRNFQQQDRRPKHYRDQPLYDSLRRGPASDYGTGLESIGSGEIEEIGTSALEEPGSVVPLLSPAQIPEPEILGPVRPMSFEKPMDNTQEADNTSAPGRRSLLDRILRRGK